MPPQERLARAARALDQQDYATAERECRAVLESTGFTVQQQEENLHRQVEEAVGVWAMLKLAFGAWKKEPGYDDAGTAVWLLGRALLGQGRWAEVRQASLVIYRPQLTTRVALNEAEAAFQSGEWQCDTPFAVLERVMGDEHPARDRRRAPAPQPLPPRPRPHCRSARQLRRRRAPRA